MEVTPPQQPAPQADDIEYLASGTLARRGTGEAAAAASSRRQYVYRKNADYDSLIEACSRNLVAQPNNVRALMIRANSYRKKGAAAMHAAWPCRLAGHRPGARHLLLPPAPQPALLSHLAHRHPHHVSGLLETALHDYGAVLRHEPGHVDAAYQRGAVCQQLGSTEQAIRDFSLVLRLDPNHAKAAYSRAACNSLVGRYDEANGEAAAAWHLLLALLAWPAPLCTLLCCYMEPHHPAASPPALPALQPTMNRRWRQMPRCPTGGGTARQAARPASSRWAAWAACAAHPPAPARCRPTLAGRGWAARLAALAAGRGYVAASRGRQRRRQLCHTSTLLPCSGPARQRHSLAVAQRGGRQCSLPSSR